MSKYSNVRARHAHCCRVCPLPDPLFGTRPFLCAKNWVPAGPSWGPLEGAPHVHALARWPVRVSGHAVKHSLSLMWCPSSQQTTFDRCSALNVAVVSPPSCRPVWFRRATAALATAARSLPLSCRHAHATTLSLTCPSLSLLSPPPPR